MADTKEPTPSQDVELDTDVAPPPSQSFISNGEDKEEDEEPGYQEPPMSTTVTTASSPSDPPPDTTNGNKENSDKKETSPDLPIAEKVENKSADAVDKKLNEPKTIVETYKDDKLNESIDVAEVFTSKDFVISWEYLTVHVPGSGWKACSCINSPLASCSQEYLHSAVTQQEAFYALASVSGYIQSGETLLVLGPDHTSKSTLLRALCGRLNSTDEVTGTVALNGIPLAERHMQSWRRASAYVSASDATHSPQLTVRETFEFAAQCTSTGKEGRDEVQRRAEYMMEVLGLSHVGDTVVGDENLRGVSGGQKRRVTVGEMAMNKSASLFCMDHITDGLASTDSLKLVKDIKRACKKHNICYVVTLLQPSDEIVSQFDKLMVLTESGEMSYFGPVDRPLLRSIFLPEDADPAIHDTGAMCDLVMNQSMHANGSLRGSGSIEVNAARRFLKSTTHAGLVKELALIRSHAPAPKEWDSLEDLLPNEKYSTSRWCQLRTISQRRIKLIMRNAMTYSRVVIAVLFGIIVGSLFSALNNDLIGGLGRTGYLFLNCFLVLMLSAAVTIPENFRQRSTLFKHRSAEFYSGRVEYFTRVFLDIPLSLLEAILLASISYYWVGMNPDPARFFYYMGVLIALEFVGQALGRFLSAVIQTQVMANTISSLAIFISAAVAGFMPSYGEIPWVLRWLNWVTPVSWAFEAIMINEFQGRTMYGVTIIDEEKGTSNIGEVSGDDWLSIMQVPRVSWADPGRIKTLDIFMLFVFAIVYDFLGMWLLERTRDWYFNQIRQPHALVKRTFIPQLSSKAELNDDKVLEVNEDMAHSMADPEGWPKSLAVKNLEYSVPRKGGGGKISVDALLGPCLTKLAGKEVREIDRDASKEIKLLNGITARFQRGKMTALMGQSGAGKTTLMDVIAGYKTGGTIKGDILIHGKPKDDATWRHISGYAEQNDILNPYLSVLETLEFTAECRLPPTADRKEIITKVINLMNLDMYTNMVIGREKDGEGLPKHARKRVTIANELVTQPRVLFLDEPTSGLGCNAAALVIGAVRRSTDALGLITLATIHQPSRKMFEAFDDLLLLAKGGRVCWSGSNGPGSADLLEYFSGLSHTDGTAVPAPALSCNPADYVLDVVNAVTGDVAVPTYAASQRCADVDAAIAADVASKDLNVSGAASPDDRKEATRKRFKEYELLIRRHILCEWRNPSYSFMRMIFCFGASLFLGILFLGDKNSIQGAIFSIASIFFLVFVLVIPMQAAVIPLIEDRAVLYRETVSGTYSRFSYGFGQLAANVPFHAINTVLMFAAFYFLVDFKMGASYVGFFLFMLFLSNWVVMSMGQLYALVTPNEETANGLAGLSIILSVCLMGFLITADSMPRGWVWAYWSNLFHYILQGLVTNEVAGKQYHIDVGGILKGILDGAGNETPDGGDGTDVDGNETNPFAILFPSGITPEGNNTAAQAAQFTAMALAAGTGINPMSNATNLGAFIECLVTNDCLVEPINLNFMSCTIIPFPRPPCRKEFNAVTQHIDILEVAACFAGDDGGTNATDSDGVPENYSLDIFNALPDTSQLELILCLLSAVLPPETKTAIAQMLTQIFNDIFDIIMAIVDIIKNGIDLPGEVILFYFGWAEFKDGTFQAPFKWHYCVTAVAVFLIAIEIFKLIAVKVFVWTKR